MLDDELQADGLIARAVQTRAPVAVHDLLSAESFALRESALPKGYRAAIALPLVSNETVVGVAARLASCTREGDIVARYGGDEFVMVLPNLSSHEAVVPVIQRVLESVGRGHAPAPPHAQARSRVDRTEALLPYRALRFGMRTSAPPVARAASGRTVTLSESA